jgi:GntR family transcriptional regulator of vanillate catabolism
MTSRIRSVVDRLRALILSGAFEPGERIVEIPIAARLGVSRTPVRIALTELEQEGLAERLASRGFRVREFPIDQVTDAIDVRGVLEGMAARIVAERGLDERTRAELEACIAEGGVLVHNPPHAPIEGERWSAMNARFHWAIVRAAGNAALESALRHNEKIPMAAASSITFHVAAQALARDLMRSAHEDHVCILHAIQARESTRVEALMREHARRSRDNKRRLIEYMKSAPGAGGIPGLRLVVGS